MAWACERGMRRGKEAVAEAEAERVFRRQRKGQLALIQ